MDNNQFYYDPNAYVKPQQKKEKPKIDLNHIERVIYPQPYENLPNKYANYNFVPNKKQEEKPKPNNNNGFNISNLLKMFSNTNIGDISKALPSLMQNLTGNNNLNHLLNMFKPVKKVEAKVVENNFSTDSILKYERVK